MTYFLFYLWTCYLAKILFLQGCGSLFREFPSSTKIFNELQYNLQVWQGFINASESDSSKDSLFILVTQEKKGIIIYHAPPKVELRFFFCFSLFSFEHYRHISYFMVCSNLLDSLDSFMPSSFVWAPLITEDNFVFLALASQYGCIILVRVIFQEKHIRLKRMIVKDFFSLVKGLSKMTFPHFKRMHLGSVSFTFFYVIM